MPAHLQFLQGTWHVAALEFEGNAVQSGPASITIRGNEFTTTNMGAEYSGHLELHPKLRTISLHFTTGPEAGHTNHGIYELLNDSWRLCINLSGGPAPKMFSTAPNSNYALELFTRNSPLPKPTPNYPRLPIAALQGTWRMQSCLRAGEPLPKPFLKSSKRVISGIDSTLHFGPQLYFQGTLYQDPDSPEHAILESTSGDLQFGIYRFHGPQLETCFAAPGHPRPTSYQSTKETRETLTLWSPWS